MPTLSFTNGNDVYTVSSIGTYDLSFLAGDDTLTVNGGTSTTARMGTGNDRVHLRSGAASIFGDLGNDRFDIYASGFKVDGGDGADRFVVHGGNGLRVVGGLGDDRVDFLANAADFIGRGNDGNDSFYGAGHTISGSIYGDAGNDFFSGFANRAGNLVVLYGGVGNDTYLVDPRGTTIIELNQQGTDTVQVALGQSFILPDNVENIAVGNYAGSNAYPASLVGNALNNIIRGSQSNVENIFGESGDDRLIAMGSGDALYGGNGADTLIGAVSSSLYGEAGNDTYYVNPLSGNKVVEAAAQGTDTIRITGQLGFDVSYTLPDNVENVVQEVDGDSFDLHGNSLGNHIVGSAGSDRIFGEGGNDIINGRDGADVIEDGLGVDRMTGGLGADVFRFWSVEGSPVLTISDLITDFHGAGSEGDKIDLRPIDAIVGQDGDQAFHFGGDAPNGEAGELWITVEADGYTHLWGDVNGDYMPDFEIRVAGAVSIADIYF